MWTGSSGELDKVEHSLTSWGFFSPPTTCHRRRLDCRDERSPVSVRKKRDKTTTAAFIRPPSLLPPRLGFTVAPAAAAAAAAAYPSPGTTHSSPQLPAGCGFVTGHDSSTVNIQIAADFFLSLSREIPARLWVAACC